MSDSDSDGGETFAATVRTLQMEEEIFSRDDFDGFSAGPREDDILLWDAHVIGPPLSPYDGGMFFLTIIFPDNYPEEPPRVRFNSGVFHPNISRTGRIALPLLREWGPHVYGLINILVAVRELMRFPRVGPLDLVLQPVVAAMCRNDFELYKACARSWTEAHRM